MKYLKIHDLLRDLCLREAEKERFYHVVGRHSPQGMCSQRRIVIPINTSKKEVLDAMKSTPYARSYISDRESVPLLPNLKLLRILKVDSYEDYAKSLGKMVNLRLVDVNEVRSQFSPPWSLQTLIAPYHNGTFEIRTTPQLRHVHVGNGELHLQDHLSDNIVIMENLQILKRVKNFKCDETMVRRLPNIKKLLLIYDGTESRDDEYCVHNIGRLQKLESLRCYCYPSDRFLRKLTFPHSLKSLTLEMGRGRGKGKGRMKYILEKISTLPLLQKLKLSGGYFSTGKWETVEGQFPSLKYLSLRICYGLECWTMESSSHFPCLEHLHLSFLVDLKEIPAELGEIPTLKLVELNGCTESAVKSAKRMVEEQEELQGEEQLSFKVTVWYWDETEEMQSLANPNFQVTPHKKKGSYKYEVKNDICLESWRFLLC
ncbi:putative late blight resistance protein homolog R1A-3 [Salvia hispanica]|uniref:putative late blight resistance protein homolog R1A-3 n=1 Tax=Salvia hispanica TaxID=49212 RepID=UPI002009C58D|nr:putative late blight resistance protein homolog R1A-3 [Salvia hispanica]